ncbi:nucleotidyltransferase family protein [Chamaesiphon polymorphus]|uniref:Nucleotidyltransferase family protein n=1 Tax=Chamaesiphon polymorphus CCALA 037 TaxID=2107692 RepID=A0A2T1GIT6_9CYAN|nr:nucleotidyltransferase family protein [Chamaesiphon polymorphus]PSB57685.1 hypothetical protein C7B77_07510 [Chamaesiphon polymorphus CCALA 037]
MTIDFWPHFNGYRLAPDRQLLLQAALGNGSTALSAWERWQSSVDIEVLDSDSYLLLPRLYQNLLAHGVEHPQMARLKGIYRRNWCANRLQIADLDRLLSDLKDIGIEAIVLGEAARSSDENYRQISSFHLLVRERDLESAIQHLTALNWHSCGDRSPTAIHLQDDRQHSLYLQGRLFWAIPQAHTDELVWQYATPRAGDVAGWQLSAPDLLLHLCARMFYRHAEPQLADLATAMLLMKPSSDLDWLRSIAQAQRYQLILPVRNTIGLLEQVLQISPPEWVLPALWQMPISQLEWLNCRVLAGDRQSWRRSQLAFASASLNQLVAPVRQLRYRPFPGRQILKNLLKPTTSALE